MNAIEKLKNIEEDKLVEPHSRMFECGTQKCPVMWLSRFILEDSPNGMPFCYYGDDYNFAVQTVRDAFEISRTHVWDAMRSYDRSDDKTTGLTNFISTLECKYE